jgi:uncharacterized spore protein YtfJ
MPVSDVLEPITSKLQSVASVKHVFGDAVTAGDHIVIPVARIAFGFGGGAAEGSATPGSSRGEGVGGGGGGGVVALPVGVFDISANGARFVPISGGRRIGAALAIGLAAGWLIGRLSR